MKSLLITLSTLILGTTTGTLSNNLNENIIKDNYNWKVTNGHDVKLGAYPWFGLINAKGSPITSTGVGAGVLISSDWILTAAHVAANFGPWGPMQITFGIYDTKKPYIPETRFSSEIVIYNGRTHWNLKQDIALVKLDKPITDIKPIKFANLQQKPKPQSQTKAMGFGISGLDNQGKPIYPEKMQEADIPIQDPSIAKDPKYQVKDFDEQYDLLAGTISGNRVGSALGDSGGPLVKKINNEWTTVGIVSHGPYDWSTPLPGVYTFVGAFHDWINNIINK